MSAKRLRVPASLNICVTPWTSVIAASDAASSRPDEIKTATSRARTVPTT